MGREGQAGVPLMFIPPLPEDFMPDIPLMLADGEADPIFIPGIEDDIDEEDEEDEPDEHPARATATAATGIRARRRETRRR